MSDRVFKIWVCPTCGWYDADPILQRDETTEEERLPRCFFCGQMEEMQLDLARISPSARATRKKEARDRAPRLVLTQVVASGQQEVRRH